MTSSAPVTSLDSLHRVTGEAADYDGLIERVGSRRMVLIGEASHGTHEFYRERAPYHPAADRRAGVHRGGPSNRIGPMRTV